MRRGRRTSVVFDQLVNGAPAFLAIAEPTRRCSSAIAFALRSVRKLSENNIELSKYCPNCGTEVHLPELPQTETESFGVAKTIESILKALGKNVKLSRAGINNWEVEEGEEQIKISYNPDNYFVAGDAFLCQLPKDPTRIKPLYSFLLEENYKLNSLVLSCTGQDIVLSCMMYDLDLTLEYGRSQFETLFRLADHYDRLLKTEFGCVDRLTEK